MASIHLPKNPFSGFSKLFTPKSKPAADPKSRPGSSPGAGGKTDMPPRRNATPNSASAEKTDRRGPPPGQFRPDAAPKPSIGAKLMSDVKIAELDKMSHAQLGQIVKFLGVPPGASLASAPLAANWKRLRTEFNEAEMRQMIERHPAEVVKFLLEPAARPQANSKPSGPERAQSAPPPRTSRPTSPPKPEPDRAQSSPPPRTSRPTAPSGPAPKPALPPISIVGMDKTSALKALSDRGMTPSKLTEMKADFFRHVQHGDMSSAAALNDKYKAFVSDDFTSSAVFASYAKLLGRLPSSAPR